MTPGPTNTEPPLVRGDINGDGRVAADDVTALAAALFAPEPPDEADVNQDRRASSADVPALIQLLPP
jgi:hypothetical protein